MQLTLAHKDHGRTTISIFFSLCFTLSFLFQLYSFLFSRMARQAQVKLLIALNLAFIARGIFFVSHGEEKPL
jgi:hypothetical protein